MADEYLLQNFDKIFIDACSNNDIECIEKLLKFRGKIGSFNINFTEQVFVNKPTMAVLKKFYDTQFNNHFVYREAPSTVSKYRDYFDVSAEKQHIIIMEQLYKDNNMDKLKSYAVSHKPSIEAMIEFGNVDLLVHLYPEIKVTESIIKSALSSPNPEIFKHITKGIKLISCMKISDNVKEELWKRMYPDDD
jgi:hypothetical protein